MLSIVTRLLRRRPTPAASAQPTALVREYIRRRDFAAAQALIDRWPRSTTEQQAEAHALQGEALFHRHQDDSAQAQFQAALALDPGHADAHYGLSLLLPDAAQAAGHAQFAVNRMPAEPRFLAQLGYLHLQLGSPAAAEAHLVAATTLDPLNAAAWNNLGLVRRIKGEAIAARASFEAALRADPQHGPARENLAQLLGDETLDASPAGQDGTPALSESPDQAIDRLEAALADAPGNALLAVELARQYMAVEDAPSAVNILEQALAAAPAHPQLLGELGLVLTRIRDFSHAAGHLERALSDEPEQKDWLLHLAACHSGRELHTQAWAVLDRAVKAHPDDDALKVQLVSALANLCRYDEALALAQELAARDIHVAGLGAILVYLGRNQEALDWLDLQLSVQPNEPGCRFLRAQLRLSQLDFAGGWDDYRFRQLGDSRNLRVLPFDLWRGESLAGKRIVVLAEQGLGDQIMFASCLPDLLARQPAEVIVEAHDRIAPTLARSFPSCRVIASRQNKSLDWVKDCGRADYYIPLADLPAQFRRDLTAFPAHLGFLRADPARAAHWRECIDAAATAAGRADGPRRPRIGLSWRGGTEGTRSFIRCVDPAWVGALGTVIDAQWVCLQYGDAHEEVHRAREAGMPGLLYWRDGIDDLDEFAALISGLDLVITVCNTTVHYAGALGIPVWVLSPMIPEWRYGLTNEVLPWYPSSRMFRQTTHGDWPGVFQRIRRALSERFAPN